MKPEFFIENNELIAKQAWEKVIQNIKASIKEDLDEKVKAEQLLSKELIKAIEDRFPDELGDDIQKTLKDLESFFQEELTAH